MAAIQEVPLYPVFPPNLATRAAVRCTQGRQIGGEHQDLLQITRAYA